MDIMIYEKLANFLSKHPKTGNGKHTHTIYGGKHGGSYTIPVENLDEFYKLVSKSIFRNKDKLSMVEKLQPVCRMVIDFDFKYKDELHERQYNQNVIKKFVELFINHIETLYTLTDDQKMCFIMEKEKVLDAKKKNYKTKDGIHFLFPYIVAEKETYKILRQSLLNEDIHKIFTDEGFLAPSNKKEEIIDEAIYSGNWFVYGAGKPDEISYQLSSIFKQSNGNIVSVPIDLYKDTPLELIKLNSVCNQKTISVQYTEELENKLKHKSVKKSISSESLEQQIIVVDSNIMSKSKKSEIDLAVKLTTQCLSESRASDFTEWVQVGLCLNHINPCEKMRNSWILFSKQWSLYHDDTECKKKWDEFSNSDCENPLTISSLKYWARTDNFDKYKEVVRDSLSDIMWKTTQGKKDQPTGPHADVANLIYHYFKDEFVCGNIRENAWYYFNKQTGGKWETTEMGHILRSKLSNEIAELFDYYGNDYKSKKEEDDDNHDRRHTNCLKIILKLKDSTYKDKIMKECREYFYDKTFLEKLNEKRNLLGFDNGIYDLETSRFREGLPDDYISLSCGLTLPIPNDRLPIHITDLKDEISGMGDYDELSDGLNDFLSKVFPIESVKEYTLRFLSSCLSGEVREEKFYFWTGSGGNGKSKLVELLDFSLGEYSRSMDVSYLTTKRGSSSSASPELESIKNARFVSMSEPEKTDQIFVGKLKQMTGGDKMTSRGLFKETTQFKPQFKMALMCNELPKLAGNDGGIWRRIEVVKYISKFTDNPKPCPAEPHQYLADSQLSTKLEQWKLLFMVLLLEKYIVYDKEGTQPPKEVREMTKSYRTSNDIIANWISDDIVECDEFNSFDELFDSWERWCDDEGYHSKQRPDKKEIKEALFKFQEKTDYGLVLGKTKSDDAPNGTKRQPRFNLRSIEE
jgi:P4 family phage/plasmid primase-like protien